VLLGLAAGPSSKILTNEYLVLRNRMFCGTITEDELTNKRFYEGGYEKENKIIGPCNLYFYRRLSKKHVRRGKD